MVIHLQMLHFWFSLGLQNLIHALPKLQGLRTRCFSSISGSTWIRSRQQLQHLQHCFDSWPALWADSGLQQHPEQQQHSRHFSRHVSRHVSHTPNSNNFLITLFSFNRGKTMLRLPVILLSQVTGFLVLLLKIQRINDSGTSFLWYNENSQPKWIYNHTVFCYTFTAFAFGTTFALFAFAWLCSRQ